MLGSLLAPKESLSCAPQMFLVLNLLPGHQALGHLLMIVHGVLNFPKYPGIRHQYSSSPNMPVVVLGYLLDHNEPLQDQ